MLAMKKGKEKTAEPRSEPRTLLEQYHSVEFSISSRDPLFQFRVRDVSPSGLGILVNKGSKALTFLKVGQILDMIYNPHKVDKTPERMKTEIRHITYLENGRFKGQYLVGLSIKNGSI